MARHQHPDIARLFQASSSHVRCREAEAPAEDLTPRRFRTYPGSARVSLPGRDFEIAAPLGAVLDQRRSIREFSLAPIALETVGRLLHASYGVRGYRQMEGEWLYDRPCPSAGGRYPLEVYLAAREVNGLPDGLHHYDAHAHELERLDLDIVPSRLADAALDQKMIEDANLVFLISAVFRRTMDKYGQRGYRYVWLDAGHLGQNLYLCATALGLGAVALGGFFDDEVNRLARLSEDGEEQIIYLVIVGHPKVGRAEEPFRPRGA
jgi:SagB-type dehydrogenase family enzyme